MDEEWFIEEYNNVFISQILSPLLGSRGVLDSRDKAMIKA
jgi:hypothetical protein